MKLKDIKDVLSFRAFRPEPDDGGAPWRKRFPREKTLLLNIGRRRVSWTALDRRGMLVEAGSADGDLKDIAAQMGHEWRALTDNGWCAVSLNHRFVITLEVNLSRRAGLEEQIRTNPKAALGAKAERGKRYQLAHNPESNTSLLLACDDEVLTKTGALLKEAGLHVGRFSAGLHGMLLDLVSQVSAARRAHTAARSGEPFGPIIMVACNEGSVAALTQREEQWVELRSRTDLYTDDMAPVLDILAPLIASAGQGAQIVFMNSETDSNFTQLMAVRSPATRVSEVTAPSQLWKLLSDQ